MGKELSASAAVNARTLASGVAPRERVLQQYDDHYYRCPKAILSPGRRPTLGFKGSQKIEVDSYERATSFSGEDVARRPRIMSCALLSVGAQKEIYKLVSGH